MRRACCQAMGRARSCSPWPWANSETRKGCPHLAGPVDRDDVRVRQARDRQRLQPEALPLDGIRAQAADELDGDEAFQRRVPVQIDLAHAPLPELA